MAVRSPNGEVTQRELNMSFRKASMAAAAIISMVSAPVLAQAASPASSLSVARAGATMEGENELGGGGFLIPVLALAAIIAGILVVIDDGDEDSVSA